MGRYAGGGIKRPLSKIAKIDIKAIDQIKNAIGSLPGGEGASAYQVAVDNGYTGTESEWLLSLIGSDANVELHESVYNHINIHASGSDNQDISGKVDKITNYSLVLNTEISKIHSSGSDNQDLSELQPKETGKGLSANDYTTIEKNKLASTPKITISAVEPENPNENDLWIDTT